MWPTELSPSLWLCSRQPGHPGEYGTGGQPKTGTRPWAQLPPVSLPPVVQRTIVISANKISVAVLIIPYCMFGGLLLFMGCACVWWIASHIWPAGKHTDISAEHNQQIQQITGGVRLFLCKNCSWT